MNQAEFRQWAMIYAMQGLLANPNATLTYGQVADMSVRMAEALLEANMIDEVPSETP